MIDIITTALKPWQFMLESLALAELFKDVTNLTNKRDYKCWKEQPKSVEKKHSNKKTSFILKIPLNNGCLV